ncbi:MAG: chorismate mutase [Planctomycetes bacterium RBG_16_64_10]|nr:MAG: chorismate mutase [Planctomycetes bacterium RBG_16_64_10]
MACRGVRGAATVKSNSRDEILAATRELLLLMVRRNGIQPDDVASAIFTTTRELNAEFPALAARQLGWLEVPLLCGNEMDVIGALPHCIRILIHWNTNKPQSAIQHVYIRGAESLRPDVHQLPDVDATELETEIAHQEEPQRD